jgi:hypothetical protein
MLEQLQELKGFVYCRSGDVEFVFQHKVSCFNKRSLSLLTFKQCEPGTQLPGRRGLSVSQIAVTSS